MDRVAEIDALVKQGYLVRTRSDENTEQARTDDTTRRDLALSSGAQMISTDYPQARAFAVDEVCGEVSGWTDCAMQSGDEASRLRGPASGASRQHSVTGGSLYRLGKFR